MSVCWSRHAPVCEGGSCQLEIEVSENQGNFGTTQAALRRIVESDLF